MRSGLFLSLGALALCLVMGCSSRGGESLFGEAPPSDIDDGTAGAGGGDDLDDEPDAGDDTDAEAPDADVESDAGEDANDGSPAGDEGGPSELPSADLACGNATCTTPNEYCCRPASGVNIPGTSASCKAANEDCRVGFSSGVPQHCSSHDQCAGGECCAIRGTGQNQNRYTEIECRLPCEGANVEVCDPKQPVCNNGGQCVESTIVRGVYVCRAP